jgi:hypothetical protein
MAPEMKSPRSPLQIAAARANGAKSRGPVTAEGKRASAANSTGPVTPEGKAWSSQNATRHGLLSDSMVLHGESDARFCALLNTLENELQPAPDIESIQTEVMAVAHWRRMRLWSLEKALYLQETLKRQDAQAEHEEGDDGETPITHLAHSFRSLADQSHALELLKRCETRYGREYLRALGCFNSQRDRKSRSSAPNMHPA